MRSTSTVLGIVAAVAMSVSFLLFQSCGKKGGGGGGGDEAETLDNATSQTTTVTDATVPTAATLADGSGLTLPAGVIPVGGTLAVETVVAPSELELADIPIASGAVSVKATDASGAAMTEFAQAGTLAISLSATAALTAVEPTDANLCALALAADGTKMVWRRDDLGALSTAQASFLTFFAGTYRLMYCANVELPGFSEMDATGQIAQVDPSEPAFLAGRGGCHYEANKCCTLAVGKDIVLTTFENEICEPSDGTFSAKGCASDGVAAYCVRDKGLVTEEADLLYTGSTTTEATCEAQGGEYLTTYVPTATDDQELPPPPTICGFELKPACDHYAEEKTCVMFVGDDITAANMDSQNASCTSMTFPWLADGCPLTREPIGCCVLLGSPGYEELEVIYVGSSAYGSTPTSAATACNGTSGTFYGVDGVVVP